LFFFFSSRRRHTRFSRDWSSDVCSSDLRRVGERARGVRQEALRVRREAAQQERRGDDDEGAHRGAGRSVGRYGSARRGRGEGGGCRAGGGFGGGHGATLGRRTSAVVRPSPDPGRTSVHPWSGSRVAHIDHRCYRFSMLSIVDTRRSATPGGTVPATERQRFSFVELDRTDVVVTYVVAALVVVGSVVAVVRRVAELLGAGPVPVRVELTGDETLRAPLGPGGADVPATAGSVVVEVPHLPGLATGVALLEAVLVPAAYGVTAVCLALFCRRVVRGAAFTAGTTRLVL